MVDLPCCARARSRPATFCKFLHLATSRAAGDDAQCGEALQRACDFLAAGELPIVVVQAERNVDGRGIRVSGAPRLSFGTLAWPRQAHYYMQHRLVYQADCTPARLHNLFLLCHYTCVTCLARVFPRARGICRQGAAFRTVPKHGQVVLVSINQTRRDYAKVSAQYCEHGIVVNALFPSSRT